MDTKKIFKYLLLLEVILAVISLYLLLSSGEMFLEDLPLLTLVVVSLYGLNLAILTGLIFFSNLFERLMGHKFCTGLIFAGFGLSILSLFAKGFYIPLFPFLISFILLSGIISSFFVIEGENKKSQNKKIRE